MSSVSLEIFTPELSQKIIDENDFKNRPVDESNRDKFSRDMAEGKWRINGATIVFDEKGDLIDGQHRLLACVKAKKSFTTYVARNILNEYVDTIDTGKARTPANVLKISGEENTPLLNNAIQYLVGYVKQAPGPKPADQKLTISERKEIIKLNPGLREAVFAVSVSNGVKKIPNAMLALIYFLSSSVAGNIEEANRWLKDCLYPDNPANKARKMISSIQDDITQGQKMKHKLWNLINNYNDKEAKYDSELKPLILKNAEPYKIKLKEEINGNMG